MAKLIYVDNQGQEATILCNAQKPVVTIGRNPDRDIKTNDTNVSRNHAEVVFENGVYRFVDNNSSNGSYVNDERIREQEIKERDVLRCGTFVMRFAFEDADKQPVVARQESTSAFNVELKDQQALLGELVRLKALKEQADAQLKQQTLQLQQTQFQLGKMQLEIAEGERKVQGLARELEDKDVLIEQLRVAAAAAGGAGDEGDASTRMMDGGAAAFVDKINEQVMALKAENAQLQQALADAQAAGASTETMNQLLVSNEKLKGENQELRVSLLATQAAAAVPEHDPEEFTAIRHRVSALESELAAAQESGAAVAQLEQENAALVEELAQLKAEQASDAADKEQVALLQEQVTSLEAELSALEEAHISAADGAADSEELEALRDQLDTLSEEKAQLQAELDTVKAEADRREESARAEQELQDQIARMREELQGRPTLADVEDLNYERRQLRDELQRVTNALEMAPSVQDFDDLRFQREQLQEELDARPSHDEKRAWEELELSLKEELEQVNVLLESAPSETDLDRLQDQIDQLSAKNKELVAELSAAPDRNEVDELQQELEMLIEDRNRFKDEKRILNEKLVQLDERKEIELRDEFDQQLRGKDAVIGERDSEIVALKKQVHEAEDVIRTANLDEMNDLRKFREEATVRDSKLQAEFAALKKTTESAVASQKTAEQRYFDQSAEVDQLMRSTADLQREVVEYKQMMVYAPTSEQVEALKDDINQLGKERDLLQKQLDTISDRHLMAFEQQEKRIGQLTEERDDANVKLRGVEKQLKEIADSGGADPSVVRELKEKNRKANDSVLDLEDKLAVLEKDRDQLDQQLRDARADSADARVEAGKVQGEYRKIQRLLGNTASADDVKKLVTDYERLQSKYEKLVDDHKLLEEMVADKKMPGSAASTADSDELKEARRENERLRARLARSSGEDSDLKQQLDKLADENAVLKSSIHSFERRITRMDESSVSADAHTGLKKRLDELQVERDRLADKLAEQSGGDRLKAENAQLSTELAELKKRLDEAKAGGGGGGLDEKKLEELTEVYEEVYDLASNWKLNIRLISQYAGEIKLGIADLKRDGANALNKMLREFEERDLMASLEEKTTTAQEDFNQLRDSLRQMRSLLDG